MPFFHDFRQQLQRLRLLSGNERVVVAVSGGPDSLCLLHLLWRLRDEYGLHLHVAHLDHGFRGAESAAEAQFVAQFAADLGLPATVERRDVTMLMHGQIANKLAAARAVRYGFLAEVAQREKADVVAVAHQADDQAETLLMHLLRGAGPAGLRGMRERVPWEAWMAGMAATLTNDGPNPTLIRPLLTTSRADIEIYCAEWNLDPRHDPSNSATTFTRSRIRLDLLPLLKEYNTHISSALAHTARVCADDYDYLQQQLDGCWPTLAHEEADRVRFDRVAWGALHPALQRYALRRAFTSLARGKEASFEQIEALRAWIDEHVGLRPNLPGDVRITIEPNSFTLVGRRPEASESIDSSVPQLERPVAVLVPGVTPIGAGWQLRTTITEPDGWHDDRWHVAIDRAALAGPLLLRGRQAGDRFRPEGGTGSRRLQDFFVDNKIGRELRSNWPLLVSGEQIVWVIGLRADSRTRPDENTRHNVWVSVERNNQNES